MFMHSFICWHILDMALFAIQLQLTDPFLSCAMCHSIYTSEFVASTICGHMSVPPEWWFLQSCSHCLVVIMTTVDKMSKVLHACRLYRWHPVWACLQSYARTVLNVNNVSTNPTIVHHWTGVNHRPRCRCPFSTVMYVIIPIMKCK